MMKNITAGLLLFASLFLGGTALAKTKRYELQVTDSIMVNGVQLKRGTYQLELEGSSLTFYQGKNEVAKVAVRVEELQSKNEATSVTTAQGKLMAIQLSGTKMRLVPEGSQ